MIGSRAAAARLYNPWRDLRDNWPEVQVRIEPMTADLLGELRYPVIALRAGTSAAQRRCTLTHELVHLERGVRDWGCWAQREEREVQAEVARRLIPIDLLGAAVLEAGGSSDPAVLAVLLDVDRETARMRLGLVTAAERAHIRTAAVRDLWSVA